MSPVVRRKGERFTLPSKYLLFILTCVCVVLMIVSLGTDLFNKPLNATVSYVVVPFQQGISKAGTWLANRSEELVQIRELLQENEALKEQIAELTVENTQLLQEKTELNRYRELYKLDMQYDSYTKVGAKIISRDAGNWYSTFIIDKGTDDGLLLDMNVIAGGGLVGRITSIGPNWAKVTSIIDDNSNVSAKTLATSDLMIVSGDLASMSEGVIRFSQLIDSQDAVAEADKVVTSHISDKYLPDILIGYIYSVEKDSNNLTKSGYLVPAVDFEHLEDVLVILERKETT
ncbi:MAG: rod shape-determining protein MreC [Lachnospiraceae bacterium]|nr:rod shape-determining protein MreC [Lachnospiraceae bacterium]